MTIFDGWDASGKKRGYRWGVAARLVTIAGVVTTPEDKYRNRIPRGGGIYGDKMIAQKSILDMGSNPNEWSHSWSMRETPPKSPKKKPTMVTGKQRHCAERIPNSP